MRLRNLVWGLVDPETKHDPFLPLVLAAEHTTRLRLGTAVAIAFPRSPMVLANIGWDLAKFSADVLSWAWARK